ncbi:MAG TPA: aldose epimerase family protein [Paludibacter sp.]|jgi:aldose 1-epimerase|nr:MAG: Aldose 1-epimerase precursor [Bacteroidetes bacterium ADurb.Bin174]HQB27491.1 aldose epimerase family protein [Paludibacter sp.]
MKKIIVSLALLLPILVACHRTELPLLNRADFQTEVDGKPVDLYLLKSGDLTLQVTNFGGRIVSLYAPDRDGKYEDVVLGHKNIDQYINAEGERFLGSVVGRYGNRIAKGQFTLDGTTYQLPINNNGQTLHGGLKGLDLVVWDVVNVTDQSIELTYTSPDGEEGFPGTLQINMTYTLTPENALQINYSATTDKPTVINLSHHSFFNLKGEGNGTINDNLMTINGSAIVPVDDVLIPYGDLMNVENTPFDFRTPTAIGERVDEEHQQLIHGKGYDHNWVLDRKTEKEVEFAASVYEPVSGRKMEVWTDQPGIQFYGGNFMKGTSEGKYGKMHEYRESLALETQHFPDSPNHENFPSTRLNPGETYTQVCIYKFSVE